MTPQALQHGEVPSFARWEQFLYFVRTQVTSIHHNVSAALQETFLPAWRPTHLEPVWLLGCKYETDEDQSDSMEWTEAETEGKGEEEDEDWLRAGSKLGARGSALQGLEMFEAKEDLQAAFQPSPLGSGQKEFLRAWAQLTRMTYRKGFAPMYRYVDEQPGTSTEEQPHRWYIKLTSDAGWGCMIRVGQMLLATTLKRLADAPPKSSRCSGCSHNIEALFLDDPCRQRCPFSIFSFIRTAHGREVAALPGTATSDVEAPTGRRRRPLTQKLPGDWFGPTTISETLAALLDGHAELSSSLAVYVEPDGVLYEDEVRMAAAESDSAEDGAMAGSRGERGLHLPSRRDSAEEDFTVVSTPSTAAWSPLLAADNSSPKLCSAGALDLKLALEFELPPPAIDLPKTPSSSEVAFATSWNRAVLLLFPLQLGLEKFVSSDAVDPLLRYFELRSSLGAMGGRPRMAHFFVGKCGRCLLYLDPHVVLPAALKGGGAGARDGPFQNAPTVQAIPVEEIDSSISLAFLVRSDQELNELSEALTAIQEEFPEGACLQVQATRPHELRADRASQPQGPGAFLEFLEDHELTLGRRELGPPSELGEARPVTASLSVGPAWSDTTWAQVQAEAVVVIDGGF